MSQLPFISAAQPEHGKEAPISLGCSIFSKFSEIDKCASPPNWTDFDLLTFIHFALQKCSWQHMESVVVYLL